MNYIDLSCPAEIFRTALPTEEIPAATLTLFNLSDRVISSVEVLLRLMDAEGGETERLAYRGRALNGRPHSTFLLTVPCAPSAELKMLDVSVEKVWFTDNDTWRRNPANSVAYTPNSLPVCPALTNLKYAAGETAVGYPSLQENLWVCVCGRPNPTGENICARCGRQMEEIFSRFTPEAVEAQISMKERQLDLSSRNMREDTIRMQRIREEEYLRKKARRGYRIRIFASMVFALALTAGALFFAEPWLRLSAGRRALETGDPAGAKKTFLALGTFGGADQLISECDWQITLSAVENSTTAEDLEKAAAMLRTFEDKPDAAEKANQTDLLRARQLLGVGRAAEALEALENLPEDYEGRAELEKECLTSQAWALQNAGDYAGAREIWLSLGDVPGAREQAAVCIYEPAVALMEAGDWDGAIAALANCPDFRDSRERTLECHYRKAEALYNAGEKESASREYLLAGSWKDAQEKYNLLTLEQANALYDAGNIRDAHALYASMPDNPDAAEKDLDCRYRLAEEAADVLEYTTVLELLADIPDEYKNTKKLRAEASYQKAKLAVRQEEWETAADLLGAVDRESLRVKHRDVEDLYLQACAEIDRNPYPETPAPETDPAAPENEPAGTPAPAPEETPGSVPDSSETAAPNPFLVTEDDQP